MTQEIKTTRTDALTAVANARWLPNDVPASAGTGGGFYGVYNC